MSTIMIKTRNGRDASASELTLADFLGVQHLLAEVDADIRRKRESLQTMLQGWWYAVRMLRRIEDEHSEIIHTGAVARSAHREMLDGAIRCGEVLLNRFAKQAEIDPLPMGPTLANLGAALKTLRADRRGWHSKMTPARRRQIMREVFGVTK